MHYVVTTAADESHRSASIDRNEEAARGRSGLDRRSLGLYGTVGMEYKVLTEGGFGSKTGLGEVKKKWERSEEGKRRGPDMDIMDMDMEVEEEDRTGQDRTMYGRGVVGGVDVDLYCM